MKTNPISEYPCPRCGAMVPVSDGEDTTTCHDCWCILTVDRDGDYVGDHWQNRTELRVWL